MENLIVFGIMVVVAGVVAYLIWTHDLDYDETRKNVDNDQTECWPHDN